MRMLLYKNEQFLFILIVITLSGCKECFTTEVYKVEFEILEYINSEGRLLNGNCCSGYKSSGLCRGGNATCHPYWKICLTKQQTLQRNAPLILPTERQRDKHAATTARPSIIKNILHKIFGTPSSDKDKEVDKHLSKLFINSTSSCSIAYWKTSTINQSTTFPISMTTFIPAKLFDEYTLSNGTSEGEQLHPRMLILLEIWHGKNEITDKLIYRYVETKNISFEGWQYGGKNRKHNTLFNSSNGIQFEYRWRVTPSSVSDLETAVSSQQMDCPTGYKGTDCKEPICLEGCDSEHGYCEEPGKCQCRFGWTGMLCDYCMTMPGCVHGNCNRPFECICEDGWTGMMCSNPKCKSGCDRNNGYCSVPGECKCRFGWQGENCTECSVLPGCQHGNCNEPLDCICNEGWEGMFCSTPKCSYGCDNKHGWCKRPDECRCKVGFTGVNCTECVPYPGCDHGSCDTTPWTCNCEPGYGGVTCSEKIDYCETNENPCENGGKCVSVEKAEDSYFCQCVVGYTGRNCEKIKN